MPGIFKKKLTIEPDDVPATGEDICMAVAKYCGEHSLPYEFLKRTEPVIAVIDGTKYEVRKAFANRSRINLWVLRCTELRD